MGETVIPEGQTAKLGTIDGDLRTGDHVLIQASDGSSVVVAGMASFEGGVEIDCNFECGSLRSEDGLVRVNGNLTVNGDANVEEALYTRGNVKAKRVDVGGRMSVGISLEVQNADIGGSLEVQGNVEADSIDVGGSFDVLGEVNLKRLDVGGSVEVGGGGFAGTVDVGGRFTARKMLRFDRIDTGATVELSGGEGKRIDVGGRLECKGNLNCDQIEVGGVADVDGNLAGKSADVGGRVRVSGDLALTSRLEVGGVAEVGGVLSGSDVEVGGSLKATKGLLSGRVRIGGRVETAQGLKAHVIEIARGASCVGPLVGDTVHIERRAQVGDVYCTQLYVEGGSRLGKVCTENADIGDSCVVGELVYTTELKEGEKVIHLSPPQKTGSLPRSPL